VSIPPHVVRLIGKRRGNYMANEEKQIRNLIDSWLKALRAKDVNGLISHYTPNVLLFDLAPPLHHSGVEVLRRGLEEWFSTFQGPIGYEVRNLEITIGGDIAFSNSINRLSGKRTSGEETDVWVRATVCYRKIDGKWLVTHEHVSVPFYMDGSDRAALDLKP
jgi:uncharacterized protein (TIGR02246 family)